MRTDCKKQNEKHAHSHQRFVSYLSLISSCSSCFSFCSVCHSAPFILIGALEDWNLKSDWNATVWSSRFASATVDFYPHNMDKVHVRPFLTNIARALEEQANPTGTYPVSEESPGSYIQWNVNAPDWEALSKKMGKNGLPAPFKLDDSWLVTIQPGCLSSKALQDEFTLRTHWRMALVGTRGAGMFNHIDVLRTSSWQAQVAGAKRWHICPPSETKWIGEAGGVNTFDPDFERFPLFINAQCYDDVVETGDMVFYPADHWHQTENVRTPTISVSANVLNAHNHELIIGELDEECNNNKYKWSANYKHKEQRANQKSRISITTINEC